MLCRCQKILFVSSASLLAGGGLIRIALCTMITSPNRKSKEGKGDDEWQMVMAYLVVLYCMTTCGRRDRENRMEIYSLLDI